MRVFEAGTLVGLRERESVEGAEEQEGRTSACGLVGFGERWAGGAAVAVVEGAGVSDSVRICSASSFSICTRTLRA